MSNVAQGSLKQQKTSESNMFSSPSVNNTPEEERKSDNMLRRLGSKVSDPNSSDLQMCRQVSDWPISIIEVNSNDSGQQPQPNAYRLGTLEEEQLERPFTIEEEKSSA